EKTLGFSLTYAKNGKITKAVSTGLMLILYRLSCGGGIVLAWGFLPIRHRKWRWGKKRLGFPLLTLRTEKLPKQFLPV
ncbi:hypothetical protein, partial [Salmonella enterica]|uniref:hypothetical protein n=1 Tax=Salmonella enterica TaxID=28901 RepID=UPI002622ED45